MKKCISILLVFSVVAILLCGCSADNKEETTTATNTTAVTSSATTSTTTITTVPSQHNVTVDEFYQEFSEKFSHTTVTKTNHYDQNYVLLEWEVDYGRSLVFNYNTMLFVDENDNIKKCETHIIRDKFHNQFSDLLSSQQQYDVIVEITFPMYLLSCYHKGIDFNNDQYSTAINDISLYKSFLNKTEYKGSLNGCSFYVKTEDFGVTSYLDWD